MKRIIFVCVENSCRSQMAEGLARHLGEGVIEAYSAGSRPSGRVNLDAVKVMQEIGIDISQYKSKGFMDLPVRDFDYLVTLGCQDTCPFVPAHTHIEWNIDDPRHKDIAFFRNIREQIKERVVSLIKEIE